MYCPMKLNNPSNDNICDQSNCAWWTYSKEDQGYCAITRIALTLEDIRDFIDSIQHKLPD